MQEPVLFFWLLLHLQMPAASQETLLPLGDCLASWESGPRCVSVAHPRSTPHFCLQVLSCSLRNLLTAGASSCHGPV